MSTCNADATTKGLKGDDRKAYMKTCLSDAPAPAAKGNSQQEKMKSCNATATTKGLKGDDRKTFMKHLPLRQQHDALTARKTAAGHAAGGAPGRRDALRASASRQRADEAAREILHHAFFRIQTRALPERCT